MFGLITKRAHKRVVAQIEGFYREEVEAIDATANSFANRLIDSRREAERLRQDLLAERNTVAELRGQLMAKAHGEGRPALSHQVEGGGS